MPITGKPRTFHRKFRFMIEIDNFAYAGFQSCSELASEMSVITQNEGGSVIPHKSGGRVTYDPITLARGTVTGDSDLYVWHRQVVEASENAGEEEPGYKRNLDIVQLDMKGNTIRRWRIYGAWPKRFVAGDWDGDADENVVESVTLEFDYYIKISG